MSKETKLGTMPKGDEGRDAVHVAIVPCKSGDVLSQGQQVKLNKDGEAVPCGEHDQPIGIADPFLHPSKVIGAGEWFWLCLYPGTVTSLAHVWEHPAFPVAAEASQAQPAQGNKEESEAWLAAYVRKHCSYWNDDADGGLREFLRYVRDEKWIYYYGSDCHSLADVDDADELFRHLSVVLGRRIDADYFEAFTCSC